MKQNKYKFTTLLLVLSIMLLLPFIKVKASFNDSFIDWTLDRSIFAHQWRNDSDHITNLAMITANGITAYCIEPGIVADKGSYYSSTNNINDTNLSWANIKKISLIGYYGYGYSNHNVKEYYMASQELIWREMGVDNVWWTDSKYGGNTINIDSYKNEILNLVNNYEVAPSFNFKKEYIVGDEFQVSDNNNVLQEYEIVAGENVNIDKNNINVKVKDGDNNFTLRRKQNGKQSVFYYKSGYQTIGSFEYPFDYEKSYSINHTYGKIIVDKLDFDTKGKVPSSSSASLEGALYGLYDEDDNLIASKKTDKNGMVVFDHLVKKNYTVREIKPSTGYTMDNNSYKYLIDTDNLNIVIKSYEKIIKNKIVITKVLDDEDEKVCAPEEGVLFHVYDLNNNLIMEKYTDKNGNIFLNLNYGKYVLRQITSLPGVDKVKDLFIEVSDDKIMQSFALVNHKIKNNVLPNTGKGIFSYFILFILLIIMGVLYAKKHN